MLVAPHAGAWIEIIEYLVNDMAALLSLPTRERGLKLVEIRIEGSKIIVAPHAGAWIEILNLETIFCNESSLPTRERGLKSLIT